MSSHDTPAACPGCDPDNPGGHLPPPQLVNLGDGYGLTAGSPALLRAAADWLDRHYPDGATGPQIGPMFGPVTNGIGLINEVMDWAPEKLTHREHKVLMVLAEDADDDERVTRQSPGTPMMLLRIRVSRTELYNVLNTLITAGCLERVTGGGRNHPATYRIPPLAP